MTGVAKRVRVLRERAGRSEKELAASIGMTAASYFDLEFSDDELETVASLRQVTCLAEHLGVTSAELFGEPPVSVERRISYRSLVARVTDYCRSEGIDPDSLAELVGWKLGSFLASEDAMLDNYSVSFVQELCQVLDIPWTHALP